jgi:hypothetical protein
VALQSDKVNEVYSLLRFLSVVFVSMGVWMAIGVGVGFVLHWLIPAIDPGRGTLIGVVALGGCFLWLSRMSTLEALYGDDDIELSDSGWVMTPLAEPSRARRKRRRRRS